MSYSEKFWPAGEALNEADAAVLVHDALAAAGFADGPDAASADLRRFRRSEGAFEAAPQGPITLPLTNPDAGRIYPEHIAMGVIWLVSVVAALYRVFLGGY